MAKQPKGPTGWAMDLIVRERDAAILAGNDPDGESVGMTVAREVEDRAIHGDQIAEFVMRTALTSWCVQLAGRACRSPKVQAAIGWNGAVIRQSVPQRVSIPKRDEVGSVLPGAGQYPLWFDIPREEYLAKLATWERELAERGRNVAVLQKGAALLARFPDAGTLREACELAGQDVEEFLLDEAAV
jgi:hypothetical protein